MAKKCPECGGKLFPMFGEDRTFKHDDVEYVVPDHFEAPTCVDCGELCIVGLRLERLLEIVDGRTRKAAVEVALKFDDTLKKLVDK